MKFLPFELLDPNIGLLGLIVVRELRLDGRDGKEPVKQLEGKMSWIKNTYLSNLSRKKGYHRGIHRLPRSHGEGTLIKTTKK